MPTFMELTKFVIDQLSPPMESEIQKDFAPWVEVNSGISENARTSLAHLFE
jgi:hypothetical protein